jgi:hypothetical protein
LSALSRGDHDDVDEEMRCASAAFDAAPVTRVGADGTILLGSPGRRFPLPDPRGIAQSRARTIATRAAA